jgi:hypothetical protein
MFRISFALTVLTLAAAAPASVACSAQSTPDGLHVIELYTSEGCSSCPPADQWLSSLVATPGFTGLEFHVDYWDNTDWRDPFDSHAYTLRQEQLSRRSNRGQTFTPQVWFDGQLWRNWPHDPPASSHTAMTPTLKLDAVIGTSVRAHIVSTNLGKSSQRVFVALTENGLSETIRGGENKGRTLTHDQVVRAFAGPFDKSDVDTELKIPDHTDRAKATLVAFVQDDTDGQISQAVKLPLAQCTP